MCVFGDHHNYHQTTTFGQDRHSMSQGSLKRLKKSAVFFFVAPTLLCVWLLLQIDIQRQTSPLFTPHFQTDPVTEIGFLVNTNGCRIADLDPFDVSVRKFVYDEKPIVCDPEHGVPLVDSNLTSLYIVEEALATYNFTAYDQFNCCYTPFWRLEANGTKFKVDVDTRWQFGDACIQFHGSVNVEHHEFVKVECFVRNMSIYKDFHAFTPLKEKVEERCNTSRPEGPSVSVLVVGVDAVSRLNLYRTMPKTIKFLKDVLNAVEMLGYNKVADNTFPNLVPVLAGLTEKELRNTCWPTVRTVFDNCPLIWKNYSKAGYRTAFAEDASWMGTFTYTKYGFHKQPTDYYTRIFNKLAEDEIGHEQRSNAKLCTGSRLSLDVLLAYASKFAITMLNRLSFGFFWGASISHDYLNLPKYADDNHVEFFTRLYDSGVFNNSVLVFMSDHGIRWGGIRATYQGHLEERLPFLFMSFPDWFRKKYPTAIGNLRKNARRLTTPFDLHETLKDLLELNNSIVQNVLRERSKELADSDPMPRGISLFLPISGKRTCSDAGIDNHWCTCHQSVSVPVNSSNVKNAVDFLVGHINALLTSYPQCAILSLNEIIGARMEKAVAHEGIKTTDVGIQDYTVTIETVPGRALFEATVRYNHNSLQHSIVGTVSRINMYGNQSACVPHYRLRLYCFCIGR